MIIIDHKHHSELGTSPSTEPAIQSDSDSRSIGTKRGDSGKTWWGLAEHQVVACASCQLYLALLALLVHKKKGSRATNHSASDVRPSVNQKTPTARSNSKHRLLFEWSSHGAKASDLPLQRLLLLSTSPCISQRPSASAHIGRSM